MNTVAKAAGMVGMHGPGARPLLCKADLTTEYNLTGANTDTGVLICTVPEGDQLLREWGSNASLLELILTLDMDFAFPAYTTVQGLTGTGVHTTSDQEAHFTAKET